MIIYKYTGASETIWMRSSRKVGRILSIVLVSVILATIGVSGATAIDIASHDTDTAPNIGALRPDVDTRIALSNITKFSPADRCVGIHTLTAVVQNNAGDPLDNETERQSLLDTPIVLGRSLSNCRGGNTMSMSKTSTNKLT